MKIKFNGVFVFRCFIFVTGFATLINGIVLSFTTNFNLGNILTLLLGAVLLSWSAFPHRINKILPKFVRCIVIAILLIALIFATFLLCFGSADTADYKEDAIIILGAAVHGETPSLVLKDRLDTAAEYHRSNPNALIIVSGGKGPQESITEAEAMEKYLISKGVSADKIIKEDKATSTHENFLYSKKILDSIFKNGYTVGFITNEYHILRAGGIAQNAGLENATHIHSSTRWYSVLPGTLRECLAVAKFLVFGK